MAAQLSAVRANADATPLPSATYAAGVARGQWQDDPAQRELLAELDRVQRELLHAGVQPRGLFGKLFGGKPAPVRGLYAWGGVGRGKTFLVDLFYAGVPHEVGKHRTHFHRFMRELHAQLRAHAGASDRLGPIARQWAAQWRLLVLDEFFVSDIGDAMLLGRLLHHLFAEGVCLVTTSNTAPEHLYKDGLQRARFLPAIELLQRHCVVHHVASSSDYRLRALTRSPVYRAPLDGQSNAWLAQRWRELGGDDAPAAATLDIDGRHLPVRARGNGLVWSDFSALCDGPRAAADYIEIATEFHTVLLGGIPVFDRNDDPARRFIAAIDEFYDRRVKLVCTAAADPPALYQQGHLAAAFERTASRLIEMQSAAYLAREHHGQQDTAADAAAR